MKSGKDEEGDGVWGWREMEGDGVEMKLRRWRGTWSGKDDRSWSGERWGGGGSSGDEAGME